MTEDDKEKLSNGSKITIWLKSKLIEAPKADEAVIMIMLNGKKIGQYLNLSLYKSIEGVERKVAKTNTPVRITVEIPEALRIADRTFSIVRVHNKVATLLVDVDNNPNTITFETDLFSTYAIVYEDVVIEKLPKTGELSTIKEDRLSAAIMSKNLEASQSLPLIPISIVIIAALIVILVNTKNRKYKVAKE